MSLSKKSIETLMDLVEIKLSCLEVMDREDLREQIQLQRCLAELNASTSGTGAEPAMAMEVRRRGRRPKMHAYAS